MEKEVAWSPHSEAVIKGNTEPEVLCKEAVMKLKAICKQEKVKEELVSDKERRNPFQTSTPEDACEVTLEETTMAQQYNNPISENCQDFHGSIILSPIANNLPQPAVTAAYQIPLKERSFKDTSYYSLDYPPPPPPSPGNTVATPTAVSLVKPEQGKVDTRQSKNVALHVCLLAISSPTHPNPGHEDVLIISNSWCDEETPVVLTSSYCQESPLNASNPLYKSDSDENLFTVECEEGPCNESPALVRNDVPPPANEVLPTDQVPTTSKVVPLLSDDPQPAYDQAQTAGASQVLQSQPPTVQSQPIIVTQQNAASNDQQTVNQFDGNGGWGWGFGWGERVERTRNANYLVLAIFLVLLSCCNPILFLCAIPACIGALVGLAESHTDNMYDDMMMGAPNMGEDDNGPGKIMNIFSLVCSIIGMTFCCFILVAFIILIIFLVSVGLL